MLAIRNLKSTGVIEWMCVLPHLKLTIETMMNKMTVGVGLWIASKEEAFMVGTFALMKSKMTEFSSSFLLSCENLRT